MASNFHVQYPPRYYMSLDGGKNNRVAKQWLLDNESPDCKNVVYGFGYVETRQGSHRINTSSVGSYACDGLFTRHDISGAESMVAYFNGAMYALSGTTFNLVSGSTSVFTAATRIYAAEYENNIFFGNGHSIPRRYDGTNFFRHGVYPPTSAPTVATSVCGLSLNTGTYQYTVTYVNSNLVESNIGPYTTTFTASGGTGFSLSDVPVAPASFGVESRYIYRNAASGAVWYRCGTISNNTSTTFVDSMSEAGLIASSQAPTANDVPPQYSQILFHAGRFFMIDPVTTWVWYTDLGNPYVVAPTNFRRIGDATAEIPKALGIWDNYLIVFCQNNTAWTVYMPDSDDANWVDFKIRSPYGSKSPLSVFSMKNKLYFAATENGKFVGFAGITAQGADPTATATEVGAIGSTLITEPIKDDISDFKSGSLGDISAIVFDNKAYISYTNSTGSYNNRIYVFDFSDESFNRKQEIVLVPWTGLNISYFAVYEGNIYGGCSDNIGHVHKLNDGSYSDNSYATAPTAIDSYLWSKEYGGADGHESWHKDFRFLNLLYEPCGNYNMALKTRTDSDRGDGLIEPISLNPNTTLWSSFAWGSRNWEAGRSEIELKKPLGQFSGKRIQFGFSNLNMAGSKFKIVGLNITYNLKGKR